MFPNRLRHASVAGALYISRYSGDIMTDLTPPTNTTFFISLILFLVGLIAHFVPQVAANVPFSGSYWIPAAAYILLGVGVTVRGV
jgi:hypothetical protein